MFQPTPSIQIGSSVIFLATSSEARTSAAAPSLVGLISRRWTGQTKTSELRTSSTVILAPSWAQGWSRAFPLFFTETSAISSFFMPCTCM